MFTERTETQLPDGREFSFWQPAYEGQKTFYVNGGSAAASDDNPGTKEAPWKTISKAAAALMPGQRVVISGGIYRETVRPARGGTAPDQMISYEAAPGETVVVKGSVAVDKDDWTPSVRWKLSQDPDEDTSAKKIYELKLHAEDFAGYNPFGMVNLLRDMACLTVSRDPIEPYVLRRGLVFADGKRLLQVERFRDLNSTENAYWVEHNGLTIHLRLAGDQNPADHLIELTNKEQVFAPEKTGLGYIAVKGITFEQVGNGNPVPQIGAVSSGIGHHFVFENCVIRQVNGTGMDVGNQDWSLIYPAGEFSSHIIRRCFFEEIGVCGLASYENHDMLVEDNTFERIGWQHSYYAWESGAVKLHCAKNLLFRRNVIRHLYDCAGIWLDCENQNNRITENIFAALPLSQEAVQIECTRLDGNLIDNNIIWDVGTSLEREVMPLAENGIAREGMPASVKGSYGCGVFMQGTDFTEVSNNLIGNCYQAGFHADPIAERLHAGRGGTSRENSLYDNIFYGCQNAVVQFANEHNDAEGNLYVNPPKEGGYLRILYPYPPELLDLEAWRRFHGWDLEGACVKGTVEFNVDTLELSVSLSETAGMTKFLGLDLSKPFVSVCVDPRK